MNKKKNETLKIKESLKDFGYRIKVRHSSAGWIRIYVPISFWMRDKSIIEAKICQLIGRDQVSVHGYEPY